MKPLPLEKIHKSGYIYLFFMTLIHAAKAKTWYVYLQLE